MHRISMKTIICVTVLCYAILGTACSKAPATNSSTEQKVVPDAKTVTASKASIRLTAAKAQLDAAKAQLTPQARTPEAGVDYSTLLKKIEADKIELREKLDSLEKALKNSGDQSYAFRDISYLHRDWLYKIDRIVRYAENPKRNAASDIEKEKAGADESKIKFLNAIDDTLVKIVDNAAKDQQRQKLLDELYSQIKGKDGYLARYKDLLSKEENIRSNRARGFKVEVDIEEADSTRLRLVADIQKENEDLAKELATDSKTIYPDHNRAADFRNSTWLISKSIFLPTVPARDFYNQYPSRGSLKIPNTKTLLLEFRVEIPRGEKKLALVPPVVKFQDKIFEPIQLSADEYEILAKMPLSSMSLSWKSYAGSFDFYKVDFAKDLKPDSNINIIFAFALPKEATTHELTVNIRDVSGVGNAVFNLANLKSNANQTLENEITHLTSTWEAIGDYYFVHEHFRSKEITPKDNILTLMHLGEHYLYFARQVNAELEDSLTGQLEKIDKIGKLRAQNQGDDSVSFRSAERKLWGEFDANYYLLQIIHRQAEWISHLRYEIIPRLVKLEDAINENAQKPTPAYVDAVSSIRDEEYYPLELLGILRSPVSLSYLKIKEKDEDGVPNESYRRGLLRSLDMYPRLFAGVEAMPACIPKEDRPDWDELLFSHRINKSPQYQGLGLSDTPSARDEEGLVVNIPNFATYSKGRPLLQVSDFDLNPAPRYFVRMDLDTKLYFDNYPNLGSAKLTIDEYGDVIDVVMEYSGKWADIIKRGVLHSKWLPARKAGVRVPCSYSLDLNYCYYGRALQP